MRAGRVLRGIEMTSGFLMKFAEEWTRITGIKVHADDLHPGTSDAYNFVYINAGYATHFEAAVLLHEAVGLLVGKDVLVRVAPEISEHVDFMNKKKVYRAYVRMGFRDRPGVMALAHFDRDTFSIPFISA